MITEIVRPEIATARRVVIKLGTRVLSDDHGGMARERLKTLMAAAADLHAKGVEVLLVSSGAVGLGAYALGLTPPIQAIAERQACAAVGQSDLMALYSQVLGQRDIRVGQVLLTHGDFEDRARYLNIRNTLLSVLRHRVLPIINENDAVSIAELQYLGTTEPVFGDNDRLSALVASKLDADVLVLLTDVPGLFNRDPSHHSDAELISRVQDHNTDFDASTPSSTIGRGGMRSKVEAAEIAARAGCHAVIASGLIEGELRGVLRGEERGSWFPASTGLSARRRWIAWGSPAKGILVIDSGAIQALRERGASLLAAGVREVRGRFGRGDVVELQDIQGAAIGRGMISCDADAASLWIGGQAPPAARNHHALVHRDHLVLEPR